MYQYICMSQEGIEMNTRKATSGGRNMRRSRNTLKKQLEKTWKVKTTAIPVIIETFEAVTPKLEEWLQ